MGEVIKYRITFDGVFYTVEKLVRWRFCFGLIRTWLKCYFRISTNGFMCNVSKLSTLDLAIRAMENEIKDANKQHSPKVVREVFF